MKISRSAKVAFGIAAVAIAGYVGSILALDPRVEPDAGRLERAMKYSSEFLSKYNLETGRFVYVVNEQGRPASTKYNVLRHSGTIYALSSYYDLTKDESAARTTVRAAKYLRARHVRPVSRMPGVQTVFSLPIEEAGANPEAKLGGAALGLIALIRARTLDESVAELETLQQIGNFILFMQQDTGFFRSKYSEVHEWKQDFRSLYYPGEAILALTLLYTVDKDPKWLDAALRAIHFLVEERKQTGKIPNDHWLMISSAIVVEHYDAAQSPPISREAILAHCIQISDTMVAEQRRTLLVPGLRGSFSPDGAVAPAATRLEGMLSLYRVLPADHPYRGKLGRSIRDGVSFLLTAQRTSGPTRGGFPRATRDLPLDGVEAVRVAEIRIDYVQHALSALVDYYRLEYGEPE